MLQWSYWGVLGRELAEATEGGVVLKFSSSVGRCNAEEDISPNSSALTGHLNGRCIGIPTYFGILCKSSLRGIFSVPNPLAQCGLLYPDFFWLMVGAFLYSGYVWLIKKSCLVASLCVSGGSNTQDHTCPMRSELIWSVSFKVADSSWIKTGKSELSIFYCIIQVAPLCPFLKAGIGFKLCKTSFFPSGGISSDPIKLQISHSQERVRAGVGKSCLPMCCFICSGGPGHSAADVCCAAWCDLSAVSLFWFWNVLAGWLGRFLCIDFVFLDKISCKCSVSFSSICSISCRCEAVVLVVTILRGVFLVWSTPNYVVLTGVWAFLRGSWSW